MNKRRAQFNLGPRALTGTLAWLRLTAIAGQSIAVLVVAFGLHLAIPVHALFAGIAVLSAFAALAFWRLRRPWPLSEAEAIAHIAADMLVLGYLLYLTGGASNPFVTLLLVPIALAAAALSRPGIGIVATLSGLAYLLLLRWYLPLPQLHADNYSDFHLLVAGMAVNFAIAALMLGVFIARLAAALRTEQVEVQRVRERALRDEGILAIATQAAGAAHELNTPLSTMRTLLTELGREHAAEPQLAEDLDLLGGQIERCRGILREMVAVGKAQLSQSPEATALGTFVQSCLEQFRLLRPEADVQLAMNPALTATRLRVPPGLRHALVNLLNNAAEASALNDSHDIALTLGVDAGWLQIAVRDHGPGFADTPAALGQLGVSGKQSGLGLGLALAEATAERLNGELAAGNAAGGGAEIRLRLPLAIIGDRP